jgi:hypothetical protein
MSNLCPSSRCQEGAILLGIVLSNGSVAFAKDRIVVDGAFVQNATTEGSRPPESRFRFSSPCAQGGCHQWTGSRCGVIDSVLEDARVQNYQPRANTPLPECSIRKSCRWFEQTGVDACSLCDIVVTETRTFPAATITSQHPSNLVLAVSPGDGDRAVRVRFASHSCAGRSDGHDSRA